MSSTVDLAQQYQRKTDREHILSNPDTYIGSVEHVDTQMYVFDETKQRIELKDMEYVPGLYKLFDEGIVNCRDHVIRMAQSTADNKRLVTSIDVEVSENGTFTLTNDGNGIDVAKHPEYDVWIPEMIFGQLRTSTNYNTEEEKIVGGKNGFGFKLVLIWSTYGYIETVDHTRGLKYTQEFKANLTEIGVPVITKVPKTTKPYTKVVFQPDYARFRHTLGDSMRALIKKRVYDIAAITDKKVKVTYNGQVVPVKNFVSYLDVYIGDKDENARVYEAADNGRWEYAVSMSELHEFQQVSFVNGICTSKGGKHVDYIMGQILRKLVDYIEKKKKVRVNTASIKEQLTLFLRCDIVNPAFDSQTKDFMNTPSNKFGSTCTVSDGFIEKIAKMGVMELACQLTEAKEKRVAAKLTDGSKTKTIRGIANFMDANWAGSATQSKDCILILCEGLSAMSGIVSGLSSADRNTIGIYPLKGKLLNVRGEATGKITDNKEITDIKKILGLENGRVYETIGDVHQYLRYGKIMVMTDQDHDGSHIKGLCINLLHSEWSSLTKIPGFISFMNTPILRATRGQQKLVFYNEGEYEAWKQTLPNGSIDGWTIKYFKGLGTSTSAEFKEYFAHKKIVDFVYTGPESDDTIDKIFNKKRADDRKTWLENYNKSAFLNTSQPRVTYEEFIDNEMIHFSTYDCARSIPNMADGLKISLRKILYCAFKKNLTKEIKVAQFSGYVSENSAYHHGEASLNGAIVAMAQNFVGSNNIPLLKPNGQFGTRLQGGDDSASERYIFTELQSLTRVLFRPEDDAILRYVNDDGTMVEPEYYLPILPFVLVNGITGIGTGFSSSIPPFHPLHLVAAIKRRILGAGSSSSSSSSLTNEGERQGEEFVPYYEGFKGNIRRIDANKFAIDGVYERITEDKIRITELPIGTWTMPYISFLETLVDGVTDKQGKKSTPLLKDFVSTSTELTVDITVQFPRGKLEELLGSNSPGALEKLLKLTTSVSTTNMHLFDTQGKLHKYTSVSEIIDAFYEVRLAAYQQRKQYLLRDLEAKVQRLSNKARYITEVLDGAVDLRHKNNQAVITLLESRGYDKLTATQQHRLQQQSLEDEYENDNKDRNFKYLTKMPMDSVSKENVDHLMQEKDAATKEYEELKATTCETMWMRELDHFEKEYDRWIRGKTSTASASASATTTTTTTNSGKKRPLASSSAGASSSASAPKKMTVVGGKLAFK